MTEKDIYKNGVAVLEEWEDVNYCEHSFKFKDEWLTDKEVVDLLDEQEKEIERLKEMKLNKLSLIRLGGFTIQKDGRRRYRIFSDNVIPKDHPIISFDSPDTIFNEFIAEYVWKLIEQHKDFLEARL